MSEHHAEIRWERGERPFTYEEYGRDHRISFGGGSQISASAATEYRGTPSLPNPEEALVAALSSCHMLTFLAIAAKKRLTVEAYEDAAVGTLAKNAEGRLAVTRCVLRPRVRFAEGVTVDAALLDQLHVQAHRGCFIAASVTTEISIESRA